MVEERLGDRELPLLPGQLGDPVADDRAAGGTIPRSSQYRNADTATPSFAAASPMDHMAGVDLKPG